MIKFRAPAPFFNDDGDTAYESIYPAVIAEDISGYCTVKALLAARTEWMDATFGPYSYAVNVQRCENFSDVSDFCLSAYCINAYVVSNFDDIDNGSWDERLKEGAGIDHRLINGENGDSIVLDELKDLETFAKMKGMEMKIFTHPTVPCALMLWKTDKWQLNTNCLKLMRFQTMFFPRLLPCIFTEKPLNEDETKLLNAVVAENETEWRATLKKIYDDMGIEQRAAIDMLTKFETAGIDAEIRDKEQEIKMAVKQMEDYMNEYMATHKNVQMMSDALNGLYARKNNSSTGELVKFFRECKRARLVPALNRNMWNNSLSFMALNTITQFDVDVFEQYISSGAYKYGDEYLKLLKDIFSEEPRWEIATVGYYSFGSGGVVSSNTDEVKNYYAQNFPDRLPNPHLYQFACIGGNARIMTDLVSNGRTEEAVLHAIASVGSINLGEGITMRPFFQNLFEFKGKCLMDTETGECISPIEALEIERSEMNA